MKKETIYIAGPECFFERGDVLLDSFKQKAIYKGHEVSLPNNTPLKLDHKDLRKNADEIFSNLRQIIYDTTMIISDLDLFRGSEPDGGTIYEIGMAVALGLKSYAYTKDLRSLTRKDQRLKLTDGNIYDENGFKHHYYFLPFSPLIMASTRVVEGDFDDCLKAYESDEYFGVSAKNKDNELEKEDKEQIFLASRDYYNNSNEKIVKKYQDKKINVVTPFFRDYVEGEDISTWLDEILYKNLKLIDESKYFLADLNDYRGFEPSNDISFMSGYAFQRGKKVYGYMDQTKKMIDKIPNLMKNGKYKDLANRDVENFDYPVNLMFSSSMKIFEADDARAVEKLIEDLKNV